MRNMNPAHMLATATVVLAAVFGAYGLGQQSIPRPDPLHAVAHHKPHHHHKPMHQGGRTP